MDKDAQPEGRRVSLPLDSASFDPETNTVTLHLPDGIIEPFVATAVNAYSIAPSTTLDGDLPYSLTPEGYEAVRRPVDWDLIDRLADEPAPQASAGRILRNLLARLEQHPEEIVRLKQEQAPAIEKLRRLLGPA